MPIERENGSARRADWSATRQAPAYARNEETRGSGKGGKDAPERQATPASSGAKMQGSWKEGSRGKLRLAEMRRARGPHSFGGLRSWPKYIWAQFVPRNPSEPLDLQHPFCGDPRPRV